MFGGYMLTEVQLAILLERYEQALSNIAEMNDVVWHPHLDQAIDIAQRALGVDAMRGRLATPITLY